jgi:hypothetical protein
MEQIINVRILRSKKRSTLCREVRLLERSCCCTNHDGPSWNVHSLNSVHQRLFPTGFLGLGNDSLKAAGLLDSTSNDGNSDKWMHRLEAGTYDGNIAARRGSITTSHQQRHQQTFPHRLMAPRAIMAELHIVERMPYGRKQAVPTHARQHFLVGGGGVL